MSNTHQFFIFLTFTPDVTYYYLKKQLRFLVNQPSSKIHYTRSKFALKWFYVIVEYTIVFEDHYNL